MSDKPLNFVILLGSLRKGSFHGALARALPALAPEGVTITALGSIGELPHYNADVQAEGFPAPVTAMAEAIAAADGVIIVTPEYNYSVPGVLKNALDWISRVPSAPFTNKPVLIQTGSPGPIGGARAQYHLRQILVFLDARTFNKPEVMVGQIQNQVDVEAGTITNAGTHDFITGQIKAFAGFARR